MIIKHNLEIRLVIFLLCALLCFSNIALAKGIQTNSTWKCLDLLDDQTKSSLSSQEQFFASLFQLPSEYEQASDPEKTRLINQWVKELHGKNYAKITEAAAYLGIVRAKEAIKPLEKVLAAEKGGGRLRWVSTRSLGQIGDKGSIPILINLLDNQNKDTRVYARVSLSEITGTYFGDDKKKWKNWGKSDTLQLCTSTERKVGEADHKNSSVRRSFSKDKLDFSLPDMYGRIVDSQDYVNVPVLIMSGPCWCGGCQQDAEPLRKLAAEYADKGLATIRTVAGDNELAALDFQKHYRLPFVQLLDTNRSFERRYNPDGWTFLMLADRNGTIVYKINSPHKKDWFELRGILNNMLSIPISNKTIIRDGIAYMPATLQRSGEMEKQHICERFPSIACGPNGQIYVVFTTNRNGSSDVFVRVFDGSKWSKDVPIAATAADEYDGTVLVDKQGHIWVCLTSNTSGRYDTFVKSFENTSQPRTPVRLTNSDDDAMHPRMACDEEGRVWVTYYKWHKMGQYSRDKEVYIRKYENGKWSDEMWISPTDVPQYEDHSDPAITAYGNGAIVAWSWDFHSPNKRYSNQAEAPTIFMRTIPGNMNLGNIFCVSGKNIDVTPVLVASDNRQIWCAWDSLGWNQRKNLCVSNVNPGRDNPTSRILSLGNPVANVCTPSFAAGIRGQLTLIWSETEDNANWMLKRADYNKQNKKWSEPQIVETKGNPRYCSAVYDSKDNLWLAYSAETDKGRKIIVTNTGKASLKFASTESDFNSSDPVSNAEATKRVRQLIDEKYSYRDLRRVDWDKLFEIYTPRLEKAKTRREFAELAAKMLLNAKDMHLWVKINGETITGFKRNTKRNYNMGLLKKEVPGWRDLSRYVSTGQFPDGIGYILIKNWKKDESQVLEPALQAIRNLSNNRALIIDVRPNGGGSEPFAEKVAGCFIGQPVVYAKHIYRDINTRTGWGQIRERTLRPNSDLPTYQGRIAVLMGEANLSSCEAFLLMMKQIPNCELIGQRSYGSSGNPKPYDLGNGVTVWLPSWRALRPDGSCFEGQGIKPDITVRATERQLRYKDPVLDSALRYLRSNL